MKTRTKRIIKLALIGAAALAVHSLWAQGPLRDPLDPKFSYDAASTNLFFKPGDLLDIDTSGLVFCDSIGVDIDGFSYLTDPCFMWGPALDTVVVLYSVDRQTRGLPGSIIRQEALGDGAAGDIFMIILNVSCQPITPPALLTNALDLELWGTQNPPNTESDLDVLEINQNCPPEVQYAYSELHDIWGPGKLRRVSPGGQSSIIDGPGLVPADDIDAFASTGMDGFMFSLTPSSPTVGPETDFDPGDLLMAGPNESPPLVLLTEWDLGMCQWGTVGCLTDNLDAVRLIDPGDRLGLVMIEDCQPIQLAEGCDTIHVLENFPILFANFTLNPHDTSVTPCSMYVRMYDTPDTIFLDAGHAHLMFGLPVGEEGEYRGDSTIYTYFVENADDPGDFIIGAIVVHEPEYICGDADASGYVDIDDVVYLVSYIFNGGPEPIPYESGDADCSGVVDIDDAVWLINYVFSNGNMPCDLTGDDVPDC